MLLLLHGGGWVAGDKSEFSAEASGDIPKYFVRSGYVVAIPNFRLALDQNAPDTSIADSASDIAKAIKWLSVNVRQYGGRSTGFVLWGFSSGAHLAALVATDGRYLEAFRLSTRDIKGVIAMDVPQYDVPHSFELLLKRNLGIRNETRLAKVLRKAFGRTYHQQVKLSPAHFLDTTPRSSSFLLISAGLLRKKPQTFSYEMALHFECQLRDRGIDARHIHFPDYDHRELISRYLEGEVNEVMQSYLHHLGLPATPSGEQAPDGTGARPAQKGHETTVSGINRGRLAEIGSDGGPAAEQGNPHSRAPGIRVDSAPATPPDPSVGVDRQPYPGGLRGRGRKA